MSWSSAVSKQAKAAIESAAFVRPAFEQHAVDLSKIVTLDFETYFDGDYTLRKLSTSEYIRDPRFKAQMVGIKIGRCAVKIVPANKVRAELQKIDWRLYALLCHHTQFDGFIMSHHYGIVPHMYYDTLSMARALHGSEIGASLDEVARFYGIGNKLPDVLMQTKGVLNWPKELYNRAAEYCGVDIDLCHQLFLLMLPQIPASEIQLIDQTVRMFCDPVLQVDLPRVQTELEREVARKRALLEEIAHEGSATEKVKSRLLGASEQAIEVARKKLSSSEQFADLLRAEGIEPPTKISKTTGKVAYAFAKSDIEFTQLLDHPSQRVRDLVDARLAVKSTINETRAGRFLTAGANGMPLPVYLKYYGAHTGRWSAGNSMNLQNLPRGGELRLSILAPAGHAVVVADSGQIECRVLAWLAGQDDLLHDIRQYDLGLDRDPYCKFADTVYGREITKKDKTERFVGKVAVLGLGYSMGAPKFQFTLASGAMGEKVMLDTGLCQQIVNQYRRRNHRIVALWRMAESILLDMSIGRSGTYKCLSWEKEKLWLPNGLCLKYPELKGVYDESRDKVGEWSYLRKGIRTKIYGGLLVENIVQALARIIIADQLLAVARAGWRVVTTTHDEIVALAKTKQAQKCYDQMYRIMITPPAWCADIPLAAEGGYAANYSK